MIDKPLNSLANYSELIAILLDRATVRHSTVAVWSDSPYTGTAEGEVYFKKGYRLRMREELDFSAGLITSYGYEVYHNGKRLFWYDDFPHPQDASLAANFPHHKHVPPNMRHNRIPAPELSFDRPNLSVILDEIEALVKKH